MTSATPFTPSTLVTFGLTVPAEVKSPARVPVLGQVFSAPNGWLVESRLTSVAACAFGNQTPIEATNAYAECRREKRSTSDKTLET